VVASGRPQSKSRRIAHGRISDLLGAVVWRGSGPRRCHAGRGRMPPPVRWRKRAPGQRLADARCSSLAGVSTRQLRRSLAWVCGALAARGASWLSWSYERQVGGRIGDPCLEPLRGPSALRLVGVGAGEGL
jgi:hypothetical protein